MTNMKLITTIITKVIGRITAPGSQIVKYFNGMKPPNSTNYLDPKNAKALKALTTSLVQFFGEGLECSDGTISPYTGPKMDKVHQPLGISYSDFIFFNDQVNFTVANLGFALDDQVAVRIVLNALQEDIVIQNSICDRYSKVLGVSNKDLMQEVIAKVFTKVTADDSTILKYFNGRKPPGSVNYLDPKNKVALDGFLWGLTTWFGTALYCSDGTVPPYAGPSLIKVHRIMRINLDEFFFFNRAVLNVLLGSGVSSKDIKTISKMLNQTQSQIVTAL